MNIKEELQQLIHGQDSEDICEIYHQTIFHIERLEAKLVKSEIDTICTFGGILVDNYENYFPSGENEIQQICAEVDKFIKQRPPQTTCGECKGKGEVEYEQVIMNCHECGGTGLIDNELAQHLDNTIAGVEGCKEHHGDKDGA